MHLELKNITFSAAMSEETNAFTADLYVNGKKVAHCKNHGRGGSTDINAYPDQQQALRDAEAWALAQEPVKGHFGEVAMDLELYVDTLLEQEVLAKKLRRLEKRNILYGNASTGAIASLGWKNTTIDGLKATPNGRKMITQALGQLNGELKDGEYFLNTNLDEFLADVWECRVEWFNASTKKVEDKVFTGADAIDQMQAWGKATLENWRDDMGTTKHLGKRYVAKAAVPQEVN